MVTIQSTDPNTLLRVIKQGIDDGKIDTWKYDEDGDFTHSVPQWKNQAWLRPTVQGGALELSLLGRTNTPTTDAVYGIYHGRFIEMVLTHFSSQITRATALPR